MRFVLHKKFRKLYAKLRESEKQKFKERRNLLIIDPFNSVLNNHFLHGKYDGYRSINITGDLRAVFKITGDVIIFVTIGTHSDLYS